MPQLARLTCRLTVTLALLGFVESAWAGKLDRAGSNARSGSSSDSSHSSSSSSGSYSSSSLGSHHSSTGDDSALAVAVIGYGIYYAALGVTSPWWLPNIALEPRRQPGGAAEVRFADYPYASKTRGLLLEPPALITDPDGYVHVVEQDHSVPRRVQWGSARFGAEYGFGVVDGISRFGVHGRVQFPLRLQFDADWSLLREHDRDGVDLVLMGREHVAIRFAESSSVQFYSGLGPQHFCDRISCIHGIDFTWGFEAFPGRPFVFSLEGAVGNLDKAFAPLLRTRLGYLIGPVEAAVGWHQRWIGDVEIGGPFVGVSGWF